MMKERFYFFTWIVLLFFGTVSAYAQEAEPEVQEETPVVSPVNEEVPNPNEIGTLESKPAVVTARPETTLRATTTPSPNKPKQEKSAEKDEDDALSFNFLYYIIQKFKLSDLKNN